MESCYTVGVQHQLSKVQKSKELWDLIVLSATQAERRREFPVLKRGDAFAYELWITKCLSQLPVLRWLLQGLQGSF